MMMIVQEDIKSQTHTHTHCNRRSDTMHTQWPLWFAGQFKCAVERIKWVNAGPLKAVKTKLRSRPPSFTNLSVPLCLSAVYLCKRTMQNKARLELADYEAVSERGLFSVSTPLFTYLLCFQLFISCLFVHTDTENIRYAVCHCIICNFPFTKAIKWITGLVILRVFSFVCEQGSLKMVPSRALYTSRAVNIISPDPSKAFFCPLYCSLFYLQESLARLQRAFARKWEFIFMQAEAQAK